MLTIIQTDKERYVLIKNKDIYVIYIRQAWISGTTNTFKDVNVVEVMFEDETIGHNEGIFRHYRDDLSADKILNRLSRELIKYGSIIDRKYKGDYDV